ncbi:uncharacterized protein LOC122025392 [Zingiber officinale]|uniref:Uncharacterized protein n=1 Tax=Zingiber officinale TaxID=94328 RepID=A0A8J5I5U6_ZINOF|nr:uncharacterized protein LOC122025392 [Zingiber officinale]KAG6536409.1 hypothetical protein ZIOFF_001464 [Zingiber officinale]
MEGVGARLGRSSTRYGPATVFSGPVRKWKKRWITVATPNNTSAAKANGNAARSRLLLYKWAPVSSTPADGAAQPEEHPPRNFRYVPISVLEEQKQEDAEKLHETYEPSNVDLSSQINRNVSSDLKPGMNDILMGESMAASDMDQNSADDNNLANLDLNLGLKGIDNERETKSRNEGDAVEKLSIGEDIKINGTNSEAAN